MAWAVMVIELNQRQERLPTDLLDNVAVGVFVELDGELIYANPALARILGYRDATDLIGRTFVEIFQPMPDASWQAVDDAAEIDGAAVPGAIEVSRADGSSVWLQIDSQTASIDGRRALQGTVVDFGARKQAQADRERAAEQLNHICELSSAWLWQTDANNRLVSIQGLSDLTDDNLLQTLVGNTRLDLNFQTVDAATETRLREAIAARMPYRDVILKCTGLLGQSFWVRSNGDPIFDASGEFGGYRGVASNITELYEANLAAKDGEARFRDLAESSVQGIVIFDDDARPLFANQAFADVFGFDSGEEILLLPSVAELVQPGELKRLQAYRDRREQGEEKAAAIEFEGVRKDGSPLWVLYHAKKIEWQGVAAVQGAVVDISERKLAQDALRANEEQMRLIADAVPAVIGYIDRRLNVVFASKAVEQRYDRPLADIIGKSVTEIRKGTLSPELAEMIERALGGERVTFEETRLDSDGDVRVFKSELIPDIGPTGDVKGFYLLSIEITEQKRIEAVLLDSEQRFKDVAEASSDWFWQMGPDLRFTYMSERVVDFTGRPADDYIGKRREMLADPEQDVVAWQRHFEDLNARRPFRDFQNFQRQSNGEKRWYSISGKPKFSEAGEFLGYSGVGSDITERRRVGLALRESERRLDQILENLPMGTGIARWDGGEVVFTNSHFREMFGLDVPGAKMPEAGKFYVDSEARSRFKEKLEAGSTIRNSETRVRRADGTEFWSLMTLLNFDYDGEPALLGFHYDITERKDAEEELARQKAILEATLENVQQGVLMYDDNLTVLAHNQKVFDILGLPAEKLCIGGKFEDWIHAASEGGAYDGGDATELFRARLAIAKSLAPYRVDQTLANGTVIDISGNPVASGGYVTTYTDVTRHKQAEAEIEAQRDQLEALNRQKDRLFSIIAHDLRSPFNAILGFSEILANQVDLLDRDKIADYAKSLNRAGNQANDLLIELLDWSRAQMGRITFEPQALPLRKCVENSLALFHPLAEAKGVKLANNVADEIEVCADARLFETIMRNLISNAVKFTADGGHIEIEAARRGDKIDISVRDTGIGMSRDELGALNQSDEGGRSTPGTAGETGTGLGMTLVREFVDKHGGSLRIESQAGRGSTFSFTLTAVC